MPAKIELLLKQHAKNPDKAYSAWASKNKRFLASLKAKSKDELLSLLLSKTFEGECVHALCDSLIEVRSMQEGLINSYRVYIALNEKKAKKVAGKQVEYYEALLSEARKHKHINQHNLAEGRKLGREERKHRANRNYLGFEKAISDLFQHGEGYKMTNEEIAQLLKARGISPYSESTTRKKVATIASGIRKKTNLA